MHSFVTELDCLANDRKGSFEVGTVAAVEGGVDMDIGQPGGAWRSKQTTHRSSTY